MSSKSLGLDQLELDRLTYVEQIRPDLRARLIPLRASRRARLGDTVALEFENADTLLYQVQEMLMVEGITDQVSAQHEIEAYSRLLPNSSRLTATLFLEANDVATVKEELVALTGIQHQIRFEIQLEGEPLMVVAGVEVPGPDEDGPSEVTNAVHFLEFVFSPAARDAFRDPAVPVEIVVEHPAYAASENVAGDLRLRLLADLALEA